MSVLDVMEGGRWRDRVTATEATNERGRGQDITSHWKETMILE